MEVLEFTNNNAFNAVFTIYFYITVTMAPIFASIAVTRN